MNLFNEIKVCMHVHEVLTCFLLNQHTCICIFINSHSATGLHGLVTMTGTV